MSYEHAKTELANDYDALRIDAYKHIPINSPLLLGIVNNYCIFLYKVLNQKDLAVKILE